MAKITHYWPHSDSSCSHQETDTYPQITPSEPHRVYTADPALLLTFYVHSHTLGISMAVIAPLSGAQISQCVDKVHIESSDASI